MTGGQGELQERDKDCDTYSWEKLKTYALADLCVAPLINYLHASNHHAQEMINKHIVKKY